VTENPSSPDTVAGGIAHVLKGRCLFLLLALLALLVLYPTVQSGRGAAVFVQLLHAGTLLGGVYAVSDTRRHIYTALLIAIPQVIVAVIAHAIEPGHPARTSATALELGLLIVFYVYAISQVLAYTMRGRRVTGDKISGVISGYLMLGLAWAFLYSLIEILAPGSMSFSTGTAPDDPHRMLDLIYFSFATITTLGYGDITPLTDRARSLALLEAVTGVLYIAVMVSSLVSAYHGKDD